MKIRKDLIKREIAGDVILVPVGSSVLEANGLYVLNELGSFIWDILPVVENIDDIVVRVLNEYEIDEKTAKKDIEVFIHKLQELEVI